ncbi:MAG: DUF429 domain-containing protein [Bacteroidia bacterium]|nr:DUF429 domain-containing protein [Bacteroidia bacterium]
MAQVVGIDGCRGGWICAEVWIHKKSVRRITLQIWHSFMQIIQAYRAAEAIAVDIPMGLWEEGRARLRPCDQAARLKLKGRASTIFTPPTRSMLKAPAYEPLRSAGLSIQAYNLIPRIREVDDLITPSLQQKIWESHPELSFTAMVGSPIPYSKHTKIGQSERWKALEEKFGIKSLTEIRHLLGSNQFQRGFCLHDVLDALALAWSAQRRLQNSAEVCMGSPLYDAKGLMMAIC